MGLQQAAVGVTGETSNWFGVQLKVRQSYILSLYLFSAYAENLTKHINKLW